MADFDKYQGPESPAGARRKQILVGVLGLMLLAVVGFHFLKGSPERAVASVLPVAGGTVSVEQTPRAEIARLETDPTHDLLLKAPTLDPNLADVPHDPFRLSERFKESLVKNPGMPQVVHVDPVLQIPSHPMQVQSIPANSMKLDGIMRIGKHLNAIFNGNVVSAGMTVGDAYILDIQQDRVIVRHKDNPEGPTTTFLIQPKMK